MFYTDRVNRQNDACSVGVRDDVLLLPKLGQLLYLRPRLSFEGTATGYFHLLNIETEDKAVLLELNSFPM